jgi:fatty-acyl-CoA synthase
LTARCTRIATTAAHLVARERITALCCAPTVLISIANAPAELRAAPRGLRVLTAAPPSSASRASSAGPSPTSTASPKPPLITICEPREEHAALSLAERARIKARQGVELITSGELRTSRHRRGGGCVDRR